jgi:hypothetical protein
MKILVLLWLINGHDVLHYYPNMNGNACHLIVKFVTDSCTYGCNGVRLLSASCQ